MRCGPVSSPTTGLLSNCLQMMVISPTARPAPALVRPLGYWYASRARKASVMSTARRQPAAPRTPSFPGITDLRVAVVGLGRLGGSLAIAVLQAGAQLVAVADAGLEASQRAAERFGLSPGDRPASVLAASPHVVFLSVPDAAVAQAAAEMAVGLASLPTHRSLPAVIHCSGVTPVCVLAPCAAAGSLTLSFHPLQTFADAETGAGRLRGAAVAVTPGPDGGFELGRMLAEALGARPFLLPEEGRVLYHAAACVAANYLVALEHVAERMFVEAGLPPEQALDYFLPLVRGAVDNLSAQGTVAALTGPLSRGDVCTIVAHLEALGQMAPELDPVYRTLGLATLDIVRRRPEVPPETIQALERLLRDGAPRSRHANPASRASSTGSPSL